MFNCSKSVIAKCYLRNGFSVIPVRKNSKEPAIRWREYTRVRMNPDLVNEFFSDNSNIAIVTGEISGLCVIDVDDHEKFSRFYNLDKLTEETGVIVKSPKGLHFWFKYDADIKTKQIRDYGFDIKSDGSLIIVPPSRYDNHVYRFIKCDTLKEIPEELKEKILALEKQTYLVRTDDNSILKQILQKTHVERELPNGIHRCYCPSHDDQNPSLDVGIIDGELYIKCWAGCSREEVMRAIGIEETKVKKIQNENATQRLLKLCEDFEVWKNQYDEAWITLKCGEKIENHRIESQSFRQILNYLYIQKFGKSANTQAILEAIQILAGKALIEGKKYQSFIRIGKGHDFIELDLVENGAVVRVTKDEIKISKPICKFKRPSGIISLPKPDLNADKDDWRLLSNFINTDTNGLILVLAWILGCFNLEGEFPILNIVGEREGIGKTTATKLIRTLVDPSNVRVKQLPKTEDDLLTVCLNNYIVTFDNLSHISDSVSDALCRISTGSGLAKRRLFTDTDSVQYAVKNPIILNGIDLFAERRDLRRRCIHFELQKITNPKPVNRILSDFGLVHPKILGWLLKAVQIALNEKVDQTTNLTDMASFVEFVCKTEKIFPVSAKEFVTGFIANRQNVSLQILADNPIVSVIGEIVRDNDEWTGTASELYEKIVEKFNNSIYKSVIPKDAKALGKTLRRLTSDLEGVGIFINFSRENLSRKIHIKKISEINVSDVTNDIPLKNKDFFGDKNMTTNDKNGDLMSPEKSLKNMENDSGDNSDNKFWKVLKSEKVEIDPDDIEVLE